MRLVTVGQRSHFKCDRYRVQRLEHGKRIASTMFTRTAAEHSRGSQFRNVTFMCYVTAMDNVTNTCNECGTTMQGRSDRKFCTPACRQKSYRKTRNETVSSHVTAKPFPIDETDSPYRVEGDFWKLIRKLPDDVAELGQYDADATPEQWGRDPDDQMPKAELYPARNRIKEQAQQDLIDGMRSLRGFLDGYDEMLHTLARARATAEIIAKHHGI